MGAAENGDSRRRRKALLSGAVRVDSRDAGRGSEGFAGRFRAGKGVFRSKALGNEGAFEAENGREGRLKGHRLHVAHLERRLGLAVNLFDGHIRSELDQRQAAVLDLESA